MSKKIFVTATDTGSGKTFVVSGLIRHLQDQGIVATAIKPVASGIGLRGINEDVETLMLAQGLSEPAQINLYSFAMPASPHIAAAAEKKKINPKRLVEWCNNQASKSDLCLIEGVGGWMVPLTDHYRVSDWVTDLDNCEIILVVGAKLGCINHALLTLNKLEHMNMMPAMVLINTLDNNAMSEGVRDTLQTWLPSPVKQYIIPHQASSDCFQSIVKLMLD